MRAAGRPTLPTHRIVASINPYSPDYYLRRSANGGAKLAPPVEQPHANAILFLGRLRGGDGAVHEDALARQIYGASTTNQNGLRLSGRNLPIGFH